MANTKPLGAWLDSGTCPHCGQTPCTLLYRFKKFGTHQMVVCPTCKAIYVDGQFAEALGAPEKED